MSSHDYSEETHPTDSPALRWALFGVGWFFVALGALGAILPVLPTTPFMLVAAACFARSSPRFYNWLLNNRVFGPLIQNWRRTRSIPRRAKILAIALIVIFISSSTVFVVENPWGRAAMVGTMIVLVTFLLRMPTSENIPDAAPKP